MATRPTTPTNKVIKARPAMHKTQATKRLKATTPRPKRIDMRLIKNLTSKYVKIMEMKQPQIIKKQDAIKLIVSIAIQNKDLIHDYGKELPTKAKTELTDYINNVYGHAFKKHNTIYVNIKKHNNKINHLEFTIIHELLHLKFPNLRHGRKLNNLTKKYYLILHPNFRRKARK